MSLDCYAYNPVKVNGLCNDYISLSAENEKQATQKINNLLNQLGFSVKNMPKDVGLIITENFSSDEAFSLSTTAAVKALVEMAFVGELAYRYNSKDYCFAVNQVNDIKQMAENATAWMMNNKARISANPKDYWAYFSAYGFIQVCAENKYICAAC